MKTAAFLALILFSLASCDKSIDELPPETQTGAHTFGAKINGEFWVPQGFGAFPANDILEARMIGNDVIINARNFSNSPDETEFEIRINDVTAPGVYQLNTTNAYPSGVASYAYYVERRITPENQWVTSSTSTGTVTITRVDTVNLIVSGTFQFNMLNINNAPEPISVTEGRFDVKIQ
jgi:hypothetical protein